MTRIINTPKRQLKRLTSRLEAQVTPRRAVLCHLILVGIPILWGVVPLLDLTIYPFLTFLGAYPRVQFPLASSMFNDRILTYGEFSNAQEAVAVQDMGWHLIYPYELCFVAWWILRNSRMEMVLLHQAITKCSYATLLFLTFLQWYHPKRPFAPLEPNFFSKVAFFQLLAIALSTWMASSLRKFSVTADRTIASLDARWSIPAISLFIGSIASSLAAFTSLQTFYRKHGLEDYYGMSEDEWSSQIVRVSFLFGIYLLAAHAYLLNILRSNIMTVAQQKQLCLYKVFLSICLPLFWLPELLPNLHVDWHKALGVRMSMAAIYITGYCLAGTGEYLGRIMAGEKAS